MVDRVGDWYAFSRTSFCRRLTIYEDLQWGSPSLTSQMTDSEGEAPPPVFSLATAEFVAMAPFGGPIAVLSRTVDVAGSAPSAVASSSFASVSSPSGGSGRPIFNLSAHSAATAAWRAIYVFTNAGELLASFPLTSQEVGQDTVKALGWTPEGELFFVLEPSLTVVFVDMRDVAVEVAAASTSPPHRTLATPSSSMASRRVALRQHQAAAAASTQSQPLLSTATPVGAFCVTTEGLLCVDGDGSGQLYGLLHEEKFRSSLVPSVRLPLQTSSSGAAENTCEHLTSATTVRQRVTAIDMVPPAWNDSGDFLVLWAQHDEAVPGAKLKFKGTATSDREANGVVSAVCAMVLPDGDLIDDYDVDIDMQMPGAIGARVPSWPAAHFACAGRVLSLSVCGSDPTRVAVFTSLGVLHVLRTNLSATLYSVDLGLCRVLRDLATKATIAADGGDAACGAFGSFPQLSHSFAFGDAPWRQRDLDAIGNASFAGGGGGTWATSADDGVANLSLRGSFSPSAAVFAGSEADSIGGGGGSRNGSGALKSCVCPPPYKLEWCGANFVLLHFYQSDFQQYDNAGTRFNGLGERQAAPMFSLLVSTQKGCSVHCERLDWSLDGSGHIATVAEDDGVRVVSDTTCYILQEVPPCLAKLCRVQPPFSAAAQVVLAYQAYMKGDRHGIALVRAALASSAATNASAATAGDGGASGQGEDAENGDSDDDEEEMSHAEGVVYDLLDAASYEFDAEQQYRLVAAASFAGETIHLRSGVPDVIVDVVRRLRVLRAVREELRCHIPLTMGQYQVLTGSEERPARLLSGTEGSVLVDRLAYLGYYQLALDVVRALHMRSSRVLSRWASSFVHRHVNTLSDAALHREVAQVLQQHPGASYVEPATTAFCLGRRDLALRLLRDEPQQQRQRVLLCVQMGELAMAGRAAAASGSAELIHLVVCALVAKEAQTHKNALHRREADGNGEAAGSESKAVKAADSTQGDAEERSSVAATGVTASDVFHCLIASPELLCWLLVGAQCLASWQSVAQRLLLSRHWTLASLECQHVLVQCLRLSSAMHRAALQQYMVDTAAGPPRAASTMGADEGNQGGDTVVEGAQKGPNSEEGKKRGKKGKKHRRHKKDGDGDDSDADVTSEDEDGRVAGRAHAPVLLPPPLHIPVPTALVAAAALTEWTNKTRGSLTNDLRHTEELRRGASAARFPFSVILDSAERLRAESQRAATQGSDDAAARSAHRRAGNEHGGRGASAATSAPHIFAHEQYVRTVLSPPTTLPLRDLAALEKEQDLAKLKVRLAVKHNLPRLSRTVSVVDLVFELCGSEDGEADASEVQRAFKVGDKMFFYAKLRGLCAAQRWDAVDRFLGPAPPLRKRSFFSSSDGNAAKAPCVGYLPVVHLLAACKQEERAARYVAGACTGAVDRVVLYMSLGAPIMALEAAMVEKDAGLIQQIMQRVPGSAKVQTVGDQMLSSLRED